MANDTDSIDFVRRAQAGQDKIRSFAFVISTCICALLCLGFVCRFIDTGQQCKIEIDSRINPNDAPEASLIRLPGIGFSRALAIVQYRQEFNKGSGRSQAFRNCDDLCKVRGIGPKTAEAMSRWLKFE